MLNRHEASLQLQSLQRNTVQEWVTSTQPGALSAFIVTCEEDRKCEINALRQHEQAIERARSDIHRQVQENAREAEELQRQLYVNTIQKQVIV